MKKKITLATFKKFIRENESGLYVRVTSVYSGMVDGLEYKYGDFKQAEIVRILQWHTLKILKTRKVLL